MYIRMYISVQIHPYAAHASGHSCRNSIRYTPLCALFYYVQTQKITLGCANFFLEKRHPEYFRRYTSSYLSQRYKQQRKKRNPFDDCDFNSA